MSEPNGRSNLASAVEHNTRDVFAQGRDTAPRLRWWSRLESRIVVALCIFGALGVGLSGYLIQLTVRYFDEITEQQELRLRETVERAQPIYASLAAAQRRTLELRTGQMVDALEREFGVTAELELETQAVRDYLTVSLAGDIASIELLGLGGPIVFVRGSAGESPVELTVERSVSLVRAATDGPLVQETTSPGFAPYRLRVRYVVDATAAESFAALGRVALGAELVEVADGEWVAREDIILAVLQALAVASSLLLATGIVSGIVVARRVTRRVSNVSSTMRRVADGELEARAKSGRFDEIGLLASDLNLMLDELGEAQRKVAYLERIGAWQGMARRIAHEIKNPLTPIQLAVQQIRKKINSDVVVDPKFEQLIRDSTEIIEDEVAALRRMVESFSQFARLPQVRAEPTDIGALLFEFRRAYGNLSERAQDVLQVELDEQSTKARVLRAMVDRQLLKQVLVNLVENAVLEVHARCSDPVSILISARLGTGNAGQGCVVVTVDDNGPGVPETKREAVFEPYETGRENGTGLGLAIVKKVILDHGGEILVEDSPLGGARFRLSLPLA